MSPDRDGRPEWLADLLPAVIADLAARRDRHPGDEPAPTDPDPTAPEIALRSPEPSTGMPRHQTARVRRSCAHRDPNERPS